MDIYTYTYMFFFFSTSILAQAILKTTMLSNDLKQQRRRFGRVHHEKNADSALKAKRFNDIFHMPNSKEIQASRCFKAKRFMHPKGSAGCSETGLSKWARLGEGWQKQFLIDRDHPSMGSWLDARKDGKVGCKVCNFAGVLGGAFAKYEVSSADALQAVNFKKHQSNPKHKSAVVCFLTDSNDGAIGAPSIQEYEELCDNILKGNATCKTQKDAKMTWTLSEAIKAVDQNRCNKSESMALFRDESKGRLAIRFRAVLTDLSIHCGTLGQARDFGSGALAITKATCQVMSRFASRFHGAPGRCKKAPFVKKDLLKKVRQNVVLLTVDSAADEILSGEMMRSSLLSGMQKKATPGLKYVLRDKTHGSRRLVTRLLNADPYLRDITTHFARGRNSMARVIHNSYIIRAKFKFYVKTSFRLVNNIVSNMCAAPHRYESMQKPFGRTCLYVHGNLRTALWCAQTRDDEAATNGEQWALWINNEKCLQGAMMADATDQTMIITRLLDDENMDAATLNGEVRSYLAVIETLFGSEEKCLTVFGYTKAMLQTLSRPLVYNVGGKVKSLGFEGPLPRAIIDRCLGRMRCWLKLVKATIAVEFPSFELAHALALVHKNALGLIEFAMLQRTLDHI